MIVWPLIMGGIVIGLILQSGNADASATGLPAGDDSKTPTPTLPPVGPLLPPTVPTIVRPFAPPPPTPTSTPTPTTVDEAKRKILALVAAPDRPPTAVLTTDGKPNWYQKRMTTGQHVPITDVNIDNAIVPNFRPTLTMIRDLQGVVGVTQDGELGPRTLNATIAKLVPHGFKRHPVTVAQLAANMVKYAVIIEKGIPVAQVGAAPSKRDTRIRFERLMAAHKLRDIGPNGQLGCFAAPPRRLQELGLMQDVTRLDGIYRGQFVDPGLAESFISNPEMQLDVFRENMADYTATIQASPELSGLVGTDTPFGPLTMSGLLGLASKAGIRGAVSWVKNPADAARYPNTTACFQRVNGLF